MQLYFTTVSLPINSLVDSPDHPLAFPPTEHGAYSAFLDINAPHDRGGAIGFLCCKLAAQLLIDRPFDARSVGWGIGGRTTKSNVPSLICWQWLPWFSLPLLVLLSLFITVYFFYPQMEGV